MAQVTTPVSGPNTSVADSLLGVLRDATGAEELAYAERPQQIMGGADTRIFAFQLANAPATFAGPLILRLFAEDDDPSRARWEAAVQNAVAGMGFPAPPVLVAESDISRLGAAFIVMRRLPGRPMLQARTLTGVLREAVRLVVSYPAILAEWQLRLHALDAGQLLRVLEAEGRTEGEPREAGVSPRSVTPEGQLDRLAERIERVPLDGLRGALRWLLEHRPNDPPRPVICHGDFHPINVLMEHGAVTGVVDWSMATVADAAFDVANTRVLLAIAPLEVPAAVDSVASVVRRMVVRRYYGAFLAHRAVDARSVRYFEALRCLLELAWVGERRAAGAGMHRNPWGSPRSVGKLISHVRLLTGIAPDLPRRDTSQRQW